MDLSKVQTFFSLPTQPSFSSFAKNAASHSTEEEIGLLSILFWGAVIWCYCYQENTSSRPIKKPAVINGNPSPYPRVNIAASRAMPSQAPKAEPKPPFFNGMMQEMDRNFNQMDKACLLYTSPSPRD